jgi:UDP-N-acetylglucosamine diphosphorylase/glucosamine-1-phosphate N-acetyltransferase
MNTILFDYNREAFLPLTFTRPIAEFRIGINTIREKWEYYFDNISIKTEDYLSKKFPLILETSNLWINSNILPNQVLIDQIKDLGVGNILMLNDIPVAFLGQKYEYKSLTKIQFKGKVTILKDISDIFTINGSEIKNDFERIVEGKISKELDSLSKKIGDYPLFIEEGANILSATLNCTHGPIYIGKNAEVMESSVIRGPFAMEEGAVVKMGSKIYGDTTIGPFCKVGGELNNVVFIGFSNKAHDGYLGNSVIGEWCNLGAGSNNSNLKNNYSEVKLWNYPSGRFLSTNLQFCGLIMGDHSKCGISTMFNTGTVVGVSANIFGSGFSRNFIPSYSWGGPSGFSTYETNKAFKVAEIVMQRRHRVFNKIDRDILSSVYDLTRKYRKA